MIKFLLKISLAASLMLAVPTATFAAQAIEIIETEQQAVSIVVSESSLRVTGANGQMLYIYNIAGVRVMSVKIDGPEKRIELSGLPNGCYIVKVGKTVRKISVR
ncbi:MAG: T9SS type A sorting domain-containing protein [Prevotella sp.]|jgi:hypothetical protein|nr:T9SS type A sorting domain-containing protein [Prevotella sp.]